MTYQHRPISDPTTNLIVGDHPAHPNERLTTTGDGAIRVVTVTDGTTTSVEISNDFGIVIGQGVAKRHKADARNPALGASLALARAFADASYRYAETVDSILNPPEDPSRVARETLRKLNKNDSVRRKNIRREKAREEHRILYGWDHNSVPDDILNPLQDALNRRAE